MSTIPCADTRHPPQAPQALTLLVGRPELVAGLLSMGRIEFVQAQDEQQALAICARQPFRVVISDSPLMTHERIDAYIRIKSSLKCDVILLLERADRDVLQAAAAAGIIALTSEQASTVQIFPLILRIIQLQLASSALGSQLDGITARLQASRPIDIATGIVMTKLNVGKRHAYEVMRRQARSLRLPLAQLAESLIRLADEAGVFMERLRGQQQSAAGAGTADPAAIS